MIGKRARYLDRDKAMSAVAGYFLSNDVSERSFQIDRSGGQWNKGKGCETFGPIGPWFVTKDEIKDPQNLDMWLDVNGEKRQRGNTKHDDLRLSSTWSGIARSSSSWSRATSSSPARRRASALGMKPEPKFLKAGRRRDARHRRASASRRRRSWR